MRAQPNVRVRIEIADDETNVARPVGQRASFHWSFFVVRAVVENVGRGTLRSATLNIVVPTTCAIRPIDPPPKGHYLSPLPTTSDRISGDGMARVVYFTVARGDLPPGDHVFHARVEPGPEQKGPWPVMVEVSGDPQPDETLRFARVEMRRDR
jgi:hypothetical protein